MQSRKVEMKRKFSFSEKLSFTTSITIKIANFKLAFVGAKLLNFLLTAHKFDIKTTINNSRDNMTTLLPEYNIHTQ